MLPDDELAAERAVLGDELQQRGHPLGELIALQLALEQLPADAPAVRCNVLARRIADHLDRHHDMLFGALAPYVDRLSKPDLRRPAMVVNAWRGGFADAIVVRDAPDIDAREALRILQELPIAQFARRLDIEASDVAALAQLATRAMPALSELHVSVNSTAPQRLSALDLSSMMPKLDELTVMTKLVDVARLASTSVRTLALACDGNAVASVNLPALESLTLVSMRVDLALLDRLPKLEELVLHSCTLEPGWVDRLVRSPQLAKMRSLNLGPQPIDGAELALLLEHADRLGTIEAELNAQPLRPFGNELLEAARSRLPTTIRVVP
jgi:hypothetical protein